MSRDINETRMRWRAQTITVDLNDDNESSSLRADDSEPEDLNISTVDFDTTDSIDEDISLKLSIHQTKAKKGLCKHTFITVVS